MVRISRGDSQNSKANSRESHASSSDISEKLEIVWSVGCGRSKLLLYILKFVLKNLIVLIMKGLYFIGLLLAILAGIVTGRIECVEKIGIFHLFLLEKNEV